MRLSLVRRFRSWVRGDWADALARASAAEDRALAAEEEREAMRGELEVLGSDLMECRTCIFGSKPSVKTEQPDALTRLDDLYSRKAKLLDGEGERIVTNARTRERVRLLEKVIDQLPVALFFKDYEGTILYMNEAARLLSPNAEIGAEAIEGEDSRENWDAEEAERFVRDDQRIIDSGEAEVYPEGVTSAHGQRLLVTAATPVPGEKTILKANIDVTDVHALIAGMAKDLGL